MFCKTCGSIYKQLTNADSFILECPHCKTREIPSGLDNIIYTEDKTELVKSNKIIYDESNDCCNTLIKYKCNECPSLYSRLVNENTFVLRVCVSCGNSVNINTK